MVTWYGMKGLGFGGKARHYRAMTHSSTTYYPHVYIAGCGDIGTRVARRWQQQRVAVTGIVRSDASAQQLQAQVTSDRQVVVYHHCTVGHLYITSFRRRPRASRTVIVCNSCLVWISRRQRRHASWLSAPPASMAIAVVSW